METNKIKLHIAGSDFAMVTDDDPKYVYELGKKVDEDLNDILNANPRLSLSQATIFLCMNYVDQNFKAKDSISDLRSQIKDYLDDASNAKSKADFARREAEMSKRENEALRAENAKLLAQIRQLSNQED